MERRRRASPLHGADLDRARRDRDRAPARRSLDAFRLASAGALLGYATVVRPSNGLFAAAAVAPVALSARAARTVPAAAAGVAFVPLVAVYWPKGYPAIENVPGFSARAGPRSWIDTLMFDPRTLLVSCRWPCSGSPRCGRWTSALLGAVIATNVALYTFYEHTHLHPRFLYVTLPALFVLEAAGAWLVIRKVSRSAQNAGYDRPRCLPRSSPAVPVFLALTL